MDKAYIKSQRTKWATPQDFFDELDAEYHFDLDVCAEPWSAKCGQYYAEIDNGIISPWAPCRCWLNPPFGPGSPILPWVKKAYEESLLGATVVAILPSSTDTAWFHDWVFQKAKIRFIRGRVQFVPPKGIKASSNRQPMFLAIWEPPTMLDKKWLIDNGQIDLQGKTVKYSDIKELYESGTVGVKNGTVDFDESKKGNGAL